jgi:N-acetyl-gamma-glutamyl-phosphate reductase
VLGASGYTGRTLCALLEKHSGLELAWAAAQERRGERALIGDRSITFVAMDDAPLGDAAVVFSALPHGASAPWVERAHQAGARVVDLSADLRPNGAHPGERVNSSPVPIAPIYGLTELARAQLPSAEVVANPGCYATAVLLGLLPALDGDLLASGATVTAAAASGVTGAGDAPRRDLLFAEVTENFRAYAVGNTHRHLAEMQAVCGRFGADVDLVFTPHLLPVARGILATLTLPLREAVQDPSAVWRAYYAGERFVEVADETPSLRDVVHRNAARMSVVAAVGVRQPMLVVTVAIDNLLKGAAGQAVQNANVLLGYDEWQGLPA